MAPLSLVARVKLGVGPAPLSAIGYRWAVKPIDPAVIAEAVERLKRAFQPVMIYHYGSSSRGEASPDSDLDLIVIVADSELSFTRRSAGAYRALRGLGVPVDVQVYTREEFRSRAALPVSFERTVVETGRLVHVA